MRAKIYCCLILMALSQACNNDKRASDPLSMELANLLTDAQKRAWLEALFEKDQHMRRGKDAEIIREHGKDSEAYRQFLLDYKANDEDNLRLIAVYLRLYGFPSTAKLGELAAVTPWAVVHHESSDSSFEVRRNYLPYMMKAYESGDLDDSAN